MSRFGRTRGSGEPEPDGARAATASFSLTTGTTPMDNRASKAGAVSKPKGRHVEVRKDRGTARKAGEIINSIARLIRAVAVLVETLRGWFF